MASCLVHLAQSRVFLASSFVNSSLGRGRAPGILVVVGHRRRNVRRHEQQFPKVTQLKNMTSKTKTRLLTCTLMILSVALCLTAESVAAIRSPNVSATSAGASTKTISRRQRKKRQLRKPDVIYYPTPPETVAEMCGWRKSEKAMCSTISAVAKGGFPSPTRKNTAFAPSVLGIELKAGDGSESSRGRRPSRTWCGFATRTCFGSISVKRPSSLSIYLRNLNLLLLPKLLRGTAAGLAHPLARFPAWAIGSLSRPSRAVGQTYRTVYLWTVPKKGRRLPGSPTIREGSREGERRAVLTRALPYGRLPSVPSLNTHGEVTAGLRKPPVTKNKKHARRRL